MLRVRYGAGVGGCAGMSGGGMSCMSRFDWYFTNAGTEIAASIPIAAAGIMSAP
jgi:hypothetical protein